jgi:hypothetical protein
MIELLLYRRIKRADVPPGSPFSTQDLSGYDHTPLASAAEEAAGLGPGHTSIAPPPAVRPTARPAASAPTAAPAQAQISGTISHPGGSSPAGEGSFNFGNILQSLHGSMSHQGLANMLPAFQGLVRPMGALGQMGLPLFMGASSYLTGNNNFARAIGLNPGTAAPSAVQTGQIPPQAASAPPAPPYAGSAEDPAGQHGGQPAPLPYHAPAYHVNPQSMLPSPRSAEEQAQQTQAIYDQRTQQQAPEDSRIPVAGALEAGTAAGLGVAGAGTAAPGILSRLGGAIGYGARYMPLISTAINAADVGVNAITGRQNLQQQAAQQNESLRQPIIRMAGGFLGHDDSGAALQTATNFLNPVSNLNTIGHGLAEIQRGGAQDTATAASRDAVIRQEQAQGRFNPTAPTERGAVQASRRWLDQHGYSTEMPQTGIWNNFMRTTTGLVDPNYAYHQHILQQEQANQAARAQAVAAAQRAAGS